MKQINLPEKKKVYFASDFHLGAPDPDASTAREQKIVQWLDIIKQDAEQVFLVGDVFDFWFEYRKVIPKGYTRLLGKLAELTDSGIKISAFIGNHDMWMDGYFEQELNIPVYTEPHSFLIGNKHFYIGHGDGLGHGDRGYKMLKKIFRNPICRWLFATIHPSWGIGLADYFSRKSRQATGGELEKFLGEDKEWLLLHCKEMEETEHFDYFILGHRHLPLDLKVADNSRYINLGDWINYFSYAVFNGVDTELKYFEKEVIVDNNPPSAKQIQT